MNGPVSDPYFDALLATSSATANERPNRNKESNRPAIDGPAMLIEIDSRDDKTGGRFNQCRIVYRSF